MSRPGEPPRHLSSVDAVCIIVGIVVGAGIFGLPPLVAAKTGEAVPMLAKWLGMNTESGKCPDIVPPLVRLKCMAPGPWKLLRETLKRLIREARKRETAQRRRGRP